VLFKAECRKLIRDYEIKREVSVINANNTGKMACFSGVGDIKTSDGSVALSDSANY